MKQSRAHKIVTISMPKGMKERAQSKALSQRRSLSNYLQGLLEQDLKDESQNIPSGKTAEVAG